MFIDNAELDDRQLGELYTRYYPRRDVRPEDYRPAIERRGFGAWLDGSKASAFRWVPKNVRVLDVGSGIGQALGYHALRGCEVWGVESDANVREIAQRHGFNVKIGAFDPRDYAADYFDVVTLDQVIEHMVDPVTALEGVRQVLKPGGTVFLSTPNPSGWGARIFGRRWINWHAPYHRHAFSRRSMCIAATRAGLNCRPRGTITASDWLRYQWIHVVAMGRPNQPSPFWSGKGRYTRADLMAMKLASWFHFVRINHLITRAFDAIGLGDSQLFELSRP